MEEIKLHGSINNSSTLNGKISTNASIEGNVGKGVTRVVTVVNEHDKLVNRDLPNQHPIDAIQGLNDELMSIKNTQISTNLSIKSLNTKIDNKIRTVNQIPSDMLVGEYIFLEKEEL